MNDALEGEQMATVDKAGIKARLKTRVGLMIGGNPEGGRWDEQGGIKEQIDIANSLWSRFDGIIFLEDEPDEQEDGELAEYVLSDYRENMAQQNGQETEDSDTLSLDCLQAWVTYARENVQPSLTDRSQQELTEYYVEIRSDDSFHDNSFPTPRKLETGLRFATAFAKLRLSETIDKSDVEMAITLSKAILGQSLNGGEMDADVFTEAEEQTQKERKERVYEYIQEHGPVEREEIIEAINSDEQRIRDDIEKLKRQGDAYEPPNEGVDAT